MVQSFTFLANIPLTSLCSCFPLVQLCSAAFLCVCHPQILPKSSHHPMVPSTQSKRGSAASDDSSVEGRPTEAFDAPQDDDGSEYEPGSEPPAKKKSTAATLPSESEAEYDDELDEALEEEAAPYPSLPRLLALANLVANPRPARPRAVKERGDSTSTTDK